MIQKIVLGVLLSVMHYTSVCAQNSEPKKHFFSFLKDTLHSPKKAVFYSALLPGTGQIYNRKYWKAPIVYAGFGAIGYSAWTNNKSYQIYRSAYIARSDNDPNTNDTFPFYVTAAGLKANRDYYRRNRDLSFIGLGLWYVLQIVDANVDAHLFSFDTNDQLSGTWQPIFINSQKKGLITGLGITLNF